MILIFCHMIPAIITANNEVIRLALPPYVFTASAWFPYQKLGSSFVMVYCTALMRIVIMIFITICHLISIPLAQDIIITVVYFFIFTHADRLAEASRSWSYRSFSLTSSHLYLWQKCLSGCDLLVQWTPRRNFSLSWFSTVDDEVPILEFSEIFHCKHM